MKNAPMAQKFCDQRRKTTFATQSANKRHSVFIPHRRAKGAMRHGEGDTGAARVTLDRDFAARFTFDRDFGLMVQSKAIGV